NDPEVMAHRKPSRVAEANIAAAERDAAAAEMKLIQWKIDHAVVRSSIDGVVLDGDLRDKIGAAVKLGDHLMVVGQPTNLRAELRVPERDIQDVREAVARGGMGDLAVTSAPSEHVPFKIERIVPSTEVKEGDTFYKVFVQF